MSKVLSVIGIIMVMIGTILSLWSIITTNSSFVGTVASLNGEWIQKEFKKQKKQVVIGCIIILIGSVLQCIGMFL